MAASGCYVLFPTAVLHHHCGMEPSAWLPAIAIAGFAAASFFCSLAETSLLSLSRWQVGQLAEHAPARGAQVARLLAKPQDLLATIVLGNTLAFAGLVVVSLWLALHGLWPWWLAIVTPLVLALLVAEVLPKTLAVRRAERWALRVARPMHWMVRLTRPLHQTAQRANSALVRAMMPRTVQPPGPITEAEYHELLELAFQQGALRRAERDIILQIISLDRRTVKEVMRPRAQMVVVSDDATVAEMIATACQHKHQRLPMFDETSDTIIGVLNAHALLLDPRTELEDALESPSFVPETMNLLQLLKALQRQRRGLAMVLDEFGGTAGLVTMEDILGELVGGIRQEHGAEGFVMEKLGPGRWHVSGTMRIEDFSREFPGIGEVMEVETMGGLLCLLLDVVPAAGQTAVFRGLKLTAKSSDERRVRELLVEEGK
jgi:CBS domain containing-hemolysin-like protein